MTITFLDIVFHVGFAAFRYTQHLKADPKTGTPNAVPDGVKGAFSLAVSTLGYKFISQT